VGDGKILIAIWIQRESYVRNTINLSWDRIFLTSVISLSSQNNTDNVKTVSRPNADLLTIELLIYILTDTTLMADNKFYVLTL
jgi:hypothetical protein